MLIIIIIIIIIIITIAIKRSGVQPTSSYPPSSFTPTGCMQRRPIGRRWGWGGVKRQVRDRDRTAQKVMCRSFADIFDKKSPCLGYSNVADLQ